jgi:hypothetical protein
MSYNIISKSLNLPIKYITNGEKLILELINIGKLHLDKTLLLSNKSSIEYLTENTNFVIPQEIMIYTIKLIKICEENDILLGNSPLSISISCLYYTAKKILNNNFSWINTQLLSQTYNISTVTILKTFNQLSTYDEFINQNLNLEY